MGFKRVIGESATRFKSMCDACFREIHKDSAALFNHKMDLALEDCYLTNKQGFLGKHLPRLVFVKLEIEGTVNGDAFLMVDFKQAITFSGLLQMMMVESIIEKRSLMLFDENDHDAFKEIVNIMRGALNRALVETSGLKLHVKQSDFVVVDLDHAQCEDARRLEDIEYIVAMGKFSVQEFEDAEFYVVFPRVTAEALAGSEFEVARTMLMLQGENADLPFKAQRYDIRHYSLTDGKYGPVQDFIIQNIDSSAILLDIPEAVGNTVEICRKIKNDPKIRHLPLIATLRMPTRAVVNAVIEAGVDELVAMPTNEEIIEARLQGLPSGT